MKYKQRDIQIVKQEEITTTILKIMMTKTLNKKSAIQQRLIKKECEGNIEKTANDIICNN